MLLTSRRGRVGAAPPHRSSTAGRTRRMASTGRIELKGPIEGRFAEILTPAALDFVAALQRELGPTRATLLQRRAERQATFDAGGRLDFLPETRGIRDDTWTVAPAPKDLERRWVELTGPAERKMV